MSKRYYVIQDIHTGLFFRCVDDRHHVPDAADTHADFYSLEDAQRIAREYYRSVPRPIGTLCDVKEGLVGQYRSWLGRRAGSAVTPQKRIANARRAKLKRKRKDNTLETL